MTTLLKKTSAAFEILILCYARVCQRSNIAFQEPLPVSSTAVVESILLQGTNFGFTTIFAKSNSARVIVKVSHTAIAEFNSLL